MPEETKNMKMDEPAQIQVKVVTGIPPAENLKGVILMTGKENFLEVEIRTLFGIWIGYWMIKSDADVKKTPEETKKPTE